MTFIGEFREKEIAGKPFHIFTLLPQTDNISSSSSDEAAIDSGDNNNLSLQPSFLCPSIRWKADELKEKEDPFCPNPFNTSPQFPSIDKQVQSLLDSDNHVDVVCKHPVLPLFWCNNENPNCNNYSHCYLCGQPDNGSSGYYLCVTCDKIFHKVCVESPFLIKQPSNPFLPLQLYTIPNNKYFSRDSIPPLIKQPSNPFLPLNIYTIPVNISRDCILCHIPVNGGMAYYCPSNKQSMHIFCALKPIPILIDHLKRHPHSLTLFPKQASLACNVCGVIKPFIPTYVCARCVFVVHQDCIYFPYVIRISRHKHRISFTYSLPSGEWSCGVCRKKVENDCGAYSCNHCDGYFVHSRCALRRDLWDGKELEGIPEEPEIVGRPFRKISHGVIRHFSHRHHLKLEISGAYDDNKLCQACVVPIYEGNCYSCVVDQCNFVLHEKCANEPIKKHNPLHARSLDLEVDTYDSYGENKGYFKCDACKRDSCGFAYEDASKDPCFRLDMRCASISEPFIYGGHEHPLFLALSPEEEKSARCQICYYFNSDCRKLNCIICSDYVICFWCVTLPYKARYKHDQHFLSFQKMKVESDKSDWCEACENKIVHANVGGFYACDEYCCTSLHVQCLLGKDPYMNHGRTIIIHKDKVPIVLNNTMSRPFCQSRNCNRGRCIHREFYVRKNLTYCSYTCLLN